jgi:DNA-binding MurR/RpiR family transcriptional regulator
MGSAEIVERIKTALDDMPVQMQVAARFIMDQPSEVALLSMREQARKAGVPPATMTRLAQRLGFSVIKILKDAYVEAVRNNVPWFSGRAVNMLNRASRSAKPRSSPRPSAASRARWKISAARQPSMR